MGWGRGSNPDSHQTFHSLLLLIVPVRTTKNGERGERFQLKIKCRQ